MFFYNFHLKEKNYFPSYRLQSKLVIFDMSITCMQNLHIHKLNFAPCLRQVQTVEARSYGVVIFLKAWQPKTFEIQAIRIESAITTLN